MIEQLPSIQFSDLLYPTADTIERLRHICASCGFFTISSHPVPATVLENARSASIGFFELPYEVKERYAHDKQLVSPSTCRGYNSHELLNMEDEDSGKECFDLGVEKQQLTPGIPFSGPTVLPIEEEAPRFTSSLLELQQVVLGSLVPVVSRALALALGKNSAFFDEYLRDLTLIQRVIYYPRDATAGRHTDNGLFTLLFHDETNDGEEASLKVYTGGKWIDVPGRKREVVVNLGDTFQIWSNGQFVSTPHKVQHKGNKPRVSLPFFVYPDIQSAFVPFGAEQERSSKVHVKDIMLNNFANIWVRGTGAGRASELT